MTDTRPIGEAELDAWRAHIGRSETRTQRIDPAGLRRYAAAVGADPNDQSAWPPLGHWAFFHEVVGDDRIGPDGHPRRGDLLPPVSLPELRMFAAAAMNFPEPLDIDREATLTLTVADVKHRAGRSGDLVFVEVDRSVVQDGRERVKERQTLVYRDDPTAPTAPVGPGPPFATDDEVWTPGPVELFRFSAVTFNSHRIHYDEAYARDAEGYPALVVHGPFSAARLFDRLRRQLGAAPRRFEFRANAPLFVSQPIAIRRGAHDGEAVAVRCDGTIAMTAQAEK